MRVASKALTRKRFESTVPFEVTGMIRYTEQRGESEGSAWDGLTRIGDNSWADSAGYAGSRASDPRHERGTALVCGSGAGASSPDHPYPATNRPPGRTP
jgi:hypothetical protein